AAKDSGHRNKDSGPFAQNPALAIRSVKEILFHIQKSAAVVSKYLIAAEVE
uniref:Fructose-bisphosphate aldolase n=1 Tax=Romanomermis culicivorax TaxID=13658 RepID=A0A915HKE6_ROMCU